MKKNNIVLDLDNTLIYSEHYSEFKKNFTKISTKITRFNFRNMSKDYIVFERPGLQTFLDFLFDNFNVSVWSAASKQYVLDIVNMNILNKPGRSLDWIFFSTHCDMSLLMTQKHKDLTLMYNNPSLNNYSKNNTFIIDDHCKVLEANGNNCIQIEPFNINDENSVNDTYLTEIKSKLENIIKQN
jgi:TFIIF-interacting CTD phosphatase-like protein